jgi:hypothetical protein
MRLQVSKFLTQQLPEYEFCLSFFSSNMMNFID